MSKLGSFDVDDIMLNTLGGILGYVLFSMLQCDTSYLEQKTKLTKLAGYLGVWRISTWREKRRKENLLYI